MYEHLLKHRQTSSRVQVEPPQDDLIQYPEVRMYTKATKKYYQYDGRAILALVANGKSVSLDAILTYKEVMRRPDKRNGIRKWTSELGISSRRPYGPLRI